MFSRYSRLFIVMTILLVTGVIVATSWVRMREFDNYQRQLAERAVATSAAEIARMLRTRRRQMALFVRDQQDFIRLLADDPGNTEIRRILTDRIAIYFPERLSYVITDARGQLLYSDIDLVLGKPCKEDIQRVLAGQSQPVRIHRGVPQHHYDLMVPWGRVAAATADAGAPAAGGVFFISFSFQDIATLLQLALPPEQELILLNREHDGLIEVRTRADGSLPAGTEPEWLDSAEAQEWIVDAPVAGSVWVLAAFNRPGEGDRQQQLIIFQGTLLLLTFLIFSAVAFYLVVGQEQRRSRAEAALLRWKDLLMETNEELRRLAVTDELTGIANRRQFFELAAVEVKRARRNWAPLSLLMIDVDKFKDYNDTYGHTMGDECLVRVAHCIREALKRPTDVVARYGGEEFVVLLPETPRVGAEQIAEAIRAAVRALHIAHHSSGVDEYVTVSIGVCTLTPENPVNLDHLVHMADEALYEAKQAGRNRVAGCPTAGSGAAAGGKPGEADEPGARD